MPKNNNAKKPIVESNDNVRQVIPEKGSKRALYIRRALEDREESKRLSSICGDDYWSL